MRELRPRTWREIVTAFLLSAYVGYKVRGMGRAVGAATASFLPSFVLMLGLLPVFERVRNLAWARAIMQGLIPGVIGVMLVALVRMVPYAAPDPLAIAALMVTTVVLIVWRTAPVKAVLGGALFGVVRDRLCELPASGPCSAPASGDGDVHGSRSPSQHSVSLRKDVAMQAMIRRSLLVGLCAITLTSAAVASAAEPDWKAVEQALGKSGQVQPGDVFRVGMPRTDLSVTVKGVAVKASFALGSYAAFKQMGDQAMVMGDLVLLDQEIPAVMSGLQSGGLEVTAVHNHLNEMSPHVMYMHYEGHGDAVQLARALRQALSASATPLGGPAAAPAPAPSAAPAIDAKSIEQALGRSGRDMGAGVFQVTAPRAETITENGMPLLPAMGVVTVLNFQALTDGKAAITGDFVLIDKEVNPVARALRQHGIDVTAIHNHGLLDTPRLFYMHFWGMDAPTRLAEGLKAALDQTNSRR